MQSFLLKNRKNESMIIRITTSMKKGEDGERVWSHRRNALVLRKRKEKDSSISLIEGERIQVQGVHRAFQISIVWVNWFPWISRWRGQNPRHDEIPPTWDTCDEFVLSSLEPSKAKPSLGFYSMTDSNCAIVMRTLHTIFINKKRLSLPRWNFIVIPSLPAKDWCFDRWRLYTHIQRLSSRDKQVFYKSDNACNRISFFFSFFLFVRKRS